MTDAVDILDQLRAVSGCTQKTFLHRPDWEDGRRVLTEAGAEIERLRKALESVAAAKMPGEARRIAVEALRPSPAAVGLGE